MLRAALAWIVLLGVVGLIAGYFIFARVGSSYVPVQVLLSRHQEGFMTWLNTAVTLGRLDVNTALHQIRMSILYSGLVGAGVGLVASILARPRSRR